MKFTVDSLSLSEAVNKVIKAISVKKSNPILECIKMSAHDGLLTLTATDMELTIEKKVVADVMIEGDILVPGKFFSDFIRTLNEETLTLECSNGTNLEITYGESYGYIRCFLVDDYPNVGEVNDTYQIALHNKDLKTLIAKTVFCASTEDNRQVLKGCLLEVNDRKATMVALDGYRLALCNKELIGSNHKDFSCIIPARSLAEINKMLVNEDEDLIITMDMEKLRVEIDSTVLISRLIKGDFINYKNIINRDFSSVVTLSKSQFEEYINRASLVSRISKN
ncbi:MAG: DNA polymerase III subunit beta, partial [Clostridia bacterium]|nr:DNA polymerase III subunit beta [Clostridia bacterium]